MIVGLTCALAAAAASGSAVILQAVAARQQPPETSLQVRLAARLLRSPAYICGLALTAAGFVLALVALRHLPLFVVQAARASSLAVVALLAVPVLGSRLRRRDLVALVGVAIGLVLLGSAAEASSSPAVSLGGRSVLLVALACLAVLAAWAARMTGPGSAYLLAAVAGGGFATLGVAARIVSDPTDFGAVLADPAAWALVGSGGLALLTFATALQRGPVAGLTAIMVATETLLASVVGVMLLGDRAAPGRWPIAVLGFVVTLVSALVVAGASTRSSQGV